MIISGDNDGMDKIEWTKTYKLLGGGSLRKQTKAMFGYADSFLQWPMQPDFDHSGEIDMLFDMNALVIS